MTLAEEFRQHAIGISASIASVSTAAILYMGTAAAIESFKPTMLGLSLAYTLMTAGILIGAVHNSAKARNTRSAFTASQNLPG